MWYIKRETHGDELFFAVRGNDGHWVKDSNDAEIYSDRNKATKVMNNLRVTFPKDIVIVCKVANTNNFLDDYDRAMRGI